MSIQSQPKCLYGNGFQPLNVLAGAIFLVPLIFTSALNDHFVFPKFLYLGICAFFAVVCISLRSLKANSFSLPSHRAFSCFALWVLWLGLVSLLGDVPGLSVRSWMMRLLSLFILYFFATKRVSLQTVVVVVGFVSFVVCGLGLLQFYGLDVEILPHFRIAGLFDLSNLVMMDRPENQEKIYSTFGHRNYLSGYLVLSIPLLLASLARGLATVARNSVQNVWSKGSLLQIFSVVCLIIVTFLSLWTIILTRTRGAFLGCSLSLVLFGSLLRYCRFFPFDGQIAKTRKKVFVAVVLLALFAGLVLFQQPLAALFGKMVKGLDPSTGSWGHRLMIWQAAVSMILDSPGSILLGYGAGAFQSRHIEFTGRIFQDALYKGKAGAVIRSWYVHNEYLNVWVDSGLVGFLLFGAFVVCLLFSFRDILRAGKQIPMDAPGKRAEYCLYLGMICGVVGALFHNIVSFTLQLPSTLVLFFAYCGILLSVTPSPTQGITGRRVITCLCFAVSLVGFSGLILDAGGEFYLRRAAVLGGARRMSRAQNALRKAALLKGAYPETIKQIGDFYFAQGKHAESLRAYTLFLSSVEDCEVRFRQALCFFEEGRPEEGTESIACVLESNPLHPKALKIQSLFVKSTDRNILPVQAVGEIFPMQQGSK